MVDVGRLRDEKSQRTQFGVAVSSLFPKVIYCHPISAVMALAQWIADQILSQGLLSRVVDTMHLGM